jgi:hypothetical protein
MYKWKQRTCNGDCESCITPVGFFSEPAYCSYSDNRYPIFLQGDKCWGGTSMCYGSETTHKLCE